MVGQNRYDADDICHLLFLEPAAGICFAFIHPILNFLIYKEKIFYWVVSRVLSSSHVLNSGQQPFGGGVSVGRELSRGKYTSVDPLFT